MSIPHDKDDKEDMKKCRSPADDEEKHADLHAEDEELCRLPVVMMTEKK